jgi:metal-sulfur cluster biosynthetic enzyme
MITEATIRDSLRQIVDPELDCNIVDLGLIYDIVIDRGRISVTMTLTTPGCPMHESIGYGVQNALLGLEGVEDVKLIIVWDPPWTPDRMTDEGRRWTGVGI